MKITSEKHNHKLTNLLKVFIFSVLMLLPFLNIAVRCGYVMLNKNAYQSAEITQTTYNKVEKIRQTNNEVLEDYYYYIDNFNFNDFINDIGSGFISFNLVEGQIYNFEDSYPSNLFVSNNFYLNIDFDFNNNTANFVGQPDNYSDIDFDDTNTFIQGIVYMIDINMSNTSLEYLPNYFEQLIEEQKIYYSYEEVESTTLDNVFEYSLKKLETEQYLTWTQNTAVYTGVNAMTTGLGITQTVIPMLIVYWFMLTIIYIIIDIVLALFTKLTHMIGNKTT